MATQQHFSFYVEMLKYSSEPEQHSLIDKICLMTQDSSVLVYVLGKKWELLKQKGKWHDCLLVALKIGDASKAAESAF